MAREVRSIVGYAFLLLILQCPPPHFLPVAHRSSEGSATPISAHEIWRPNWRPISAHETTCRGNVGAIRGL